MTRQSKVNKVLILELFLNLATTDKVAKKDKYLHSEKVLVLNEKF